MKCPKCEKVIQDNSDFCYFCGQMLKTLPSPPAHTIMPSLPPVTVPAPSDPRRAALFRRYQDAYQIAGAMNAAGEVVKWIAGGVAGLIGFGLMVRMSTTGGDSGILAFIELLCTVATGAFFYVIGMALASLGQIQKATLDSAVYSSTFLTNDDRAQIMSLPMKAQSTSA